MATNFNNKAVITRGGLRPSTVNTPLDIRTRLESIADVESIPLPYVGMMFYVIDENKFYFVKSLKPKVVGGKEIADMLVNEFEEFVSSVTGEQGGQGAQGPQGEKGEQGE